MDDWATYLDQRGLAQPSSRPARDSGKWAYRYLERIGCALEPRGTTADSVVSFGVAWPRQSGY